MKGFLPKGVNSTILALIPKKGCSNGDERLPLNLIRPQYILTTVRQIEDAFKEFSSRDDTAIILISQYVKALSSNSTLYFYFFINYSLCQIQKNFLRPLRGSHGTANMIRFLVDSYNKPVPAILVIPSKDHPYDPAHDSVLSRVKYLFSAESVSQR
ncbi:hypothetical protein Bca52824_023650 [Brassica carinata]|uniref:Uncharacterized protein n=1 Tax=Brassica carinata TaxID=52824 RepID=A0A8X7VI69_BRACI|nr:hypothetical protein Bca52824_023650 [Brassica carinata]